METIFGGFSGTVNSFKIFGQFRYCFKFNCDYTRQLWQILPFLQFDRSNQFSNHVDRFDNFHNFDRFDTFQSLDHFHQFNCFKVLTTLQLFRPLNVDQVNSFHHCGCFENFYIFHQSVFDRFNGFHRFGGVESAWNEEEFYVSSTVCKVRKYQNKTFSLLKTYSVTSFLRRERQVNVNDLEASLFGRSVSI